MENNEEKFIKYIIEEYNDYNVNINNLRKNLDLYKAVSKKINHNPENEVEKILNMFFINIYNSLDVLLILIDKRKISDTNVIARKIVEIYIKNEYLKKNDKYKHYYRKKYCEHAKHLYTLIKAHSRAKDIIKNPLWINRNLIIKENKELYKDEKEGTLTKLEDSIEKMAKEVGLLYLYKVTYADWSSSTHCNMCTEGEIKYETKTGFKYDMPGEDNGNKKVNVNVINKINYILYLFIESFCSQLAICNGQLDRFKKNNQFTTWDLCTGSVSSVNQIASKVVKYYWGVEESFDEFDEKRIFESDELVLKRTCGLEELVRMTEQEIQGYLMLK
ncbi:hypothetical protein KPL39_09010 [Clostridium gasigenes]|uniref:DUF5677 domain-containing protein n=1 Tax=Clostridium gasigenes TaxID=94869 RepID=UPI001C0D4BF1|nr:DUF5677 domain-containing protein [Clostridium gasigenes]MBU3136409.1 hypothetical protein [Clostridium gasigenes]